MQQRDIIKDQIDQLGRVLGKIVADLLGLKAEGKVAQGIEIANEQLKKMGNIDVSNIVNMNDEEFQDFIKTHPLNAGSLEHLADYLIEVGDFKKEDLPAQARQLYKHASAAYEEANRRSDEYSMPRASKQKLIDRKIMDF